MPDPNFIAEIREPWVRIDIITPTDYIGPIMDLVTRRRGEFKHQEYLDPTRVQLSHDIPHRNPGGFLQRAEARTRLYASLDYHFCSIRPANLVKLDLLVAGQPVDALSIIVHADKAYHEGQRLVSKMKEVIRGSSSMWPSRLPSANGSSSGQCQGPAQGRAGQMLWR